MVPPLPLPPPAINMSLSTPPPPLVKMSLPTPPLIPVKALTIRSHATIAHEYEVDQDKYNIDKQQHIMYDANEFHGDYDELHAEKEQSESYEFGDKQEKYNIEQQQPIIFDVDNSDDDCDNSCVEKKQSVTCHNVDDSDDDCDEPHAGKIQSNTCYEGDITCLSGSLLGIKRKKFEDIYDLYQKHAYEVGFSVRKSITRYNVFGVMVNKLLVCSCEGTRRSSSNNDVKGKKKASLITRTNCKASLRAKLVADGFYEVVEHHLEHNHTLCRSEWSYMHRSQRSISLEKATIIEDMISSGMRATDSYRYMTKNAGGEHILGHTKKDHFNFVNRLKVAAIDGGDAQTLIDNLNQHGVEDKDFFFRVKLDDEGRLCNIFWRLNDEGGLYDIWRCCCL